MGVVILLATGRGDRYHGTLHHHHRMRALAALSSEALLIRLRSGATAPISALNFKLSAPEIEELAGKIMAATDRCGPTDRGALFFGCWASWQLPFAGGPSRLGACLGESLLRSPMMRSPMNFAHRALSEARGNLCGREADWEPPHIVHISQD